MAADENLASQIVEEVGELSPEKQPQVPRFAQSLAALFKGTPGKDCLEFLC